MGERSFAHTCGILKLCHLHIQHINQTASVVVADKGGQADKVVHSYAEAGHGRALVAAQGLWG